MRLDKYNLATSFSKILPPHTTSTVRPSKYRDCRLDIVRTIAIIAVLFCHTFAGYKQLSALEGVFRVIGEIGVPLFIMLTGCLNRNKTIEDYYERGKWKGCFRVLIAYIVLGTICYIVDSFVYEKVISIRSFIIQLLGFRLTPYGWYIEMWIGLYFLTPLLNVWLKGMSQKQEKINVITLLLLIQLPIFVNRHNYYFLPHYWVGLYPIPLYFLGAYFAKYPIQLKTRWLCLVFYSIVLLEPMVNIVIGHNNYYSLLGANNIVTTFLACSVFCFCLKINEDKVVFMGFWKLVSEISLYMYLISYVFDVTFKQCLMPETFDSLIERFPWSFLMFCSTLLLSIITGIIYKKIEHSILML